MTALVADICNRDRSVNQDRNWSAAGAVDRVIRVSTAIVVLAVAAIAAYISYWHAYAVVREYGESGATARLEPATIDGLVYASSAVILYAARHRLPVPSLARWMLTLGIVATLAANMAQGWSHGPGGMVVAAWPAVSLVGSYELLVWIIRKAAADDPYRVPTADHVPASHGSPQPDHPFGGTRAATAQTADGGPNDRHVPITSPVPASQNGPRPVDQGAGADQHSGPRRDAPDHASDQIRAWLRIGGDTSLDSDDDINAAAVAAYRASIQAGRPLSERKLAGMFGKTSRRWARSRIAEAQAAAGGLKRKPEGSSWA